MSELGPAWLRTELPYPIARAIHLAELHSPIDAALMADVVETALRFVAGVHLANLEANGQDHPANILDSFSRPPTLGVWLDLVQILREANTRPVAASLGRWPNDTESENLSRLVKVRNQLAHPRGMLPELRKRLDKEMRALTTDVLLSLSWMKRVSLFHVSDPQTLANGLASGGVHRWTGLVSHRPQRKPVSWRDADLTAERLYLGFELDDGRIRALDVHNYIRFSSLLSNLAPDVLLWSRLGRRREILFQAPANATSAWLPVLPSVGITHVVWSDGRSIQSTGTLPDHVQNLARNVARTTAPTVIESLSTLPHRTAVSSSRATLKWIGIGALIAAIAIGTWAITSWKKTPAPSTASTSPDEMASVQTNTTVIHPSTETFGTVVPRAEAPIQVRAQPGSGPAATRLEFERPERVAASRRTCHQSPDLVGTWVFKTTVLGANPDRTRSKGINGYYRINLAKPEGCWFETEFVKTGFSGSAQDYKVAFADRPPFVISTTGTSAFGLAILRAKPTAPDSTDIGFRVMRVGPHLVGLWRYEGLARNKAGFWGGLVGKRDGALEPPSSRCFLDCIEQCHGDRPASDEGTERCLTSCAPKLLSCEG